MIFLSGPPITNIPKFLSKLKASFCCVRQSIMARWKGHIFSINNKQSYTFHLAHMLTRDETQLQGSFKWKFIQYLMCSQSLQSQLPCFMSQIIPLYSFNVLRIFFLSESFHFLLKGMFQSLFPSQDFMEPKLQLLKLNCLLKNNMHGFVMSYL